MKVCMEAGGGARRSLIFNRAIKHGYRLGARTIVRSRSQLTVTINPYDTIEGSARELTHTEKFSRGGQFNARNIATESFEEKSLEG